MNDEFYKEPPHFLQVLFPSFFFFLFFFNFHVGLVSSNPSALVICALQNYLLTYLLECRAVTLPIRETH